MTFRRITPSIYDLLEFWFLCWRICLSLFCPRFSSFHRGPQHEYLEISIVQRSASLQGSVIYLHRTMVTSSAGRGLVWFGTLHHWIFYFILFLLAHCGLLLWCSRALATLRLRLLPFCLAIRVHRLILSLRACLRPLPFFEVCSACSSFSSSPFRGYTPPPTPR